MKQPQWKDLKNIYFSPADGVDESSDAYHREMGRLLAAVGRDEGKPLVFNDSRKK